MESGCSYFAFHSSLSVENRNNGIYTDSTDDPLNHIFMTAESSWLSFSFYCATLW